jgi:hypothetical protein
MSLLHQEPGEELDDAALGEELTKGTSPIVWARLSAVALLTLVIVLFVTYWQKSPMVTGEIVQVWAHPRHIQTSGFDANGEVKAQKQFDQVLLFAHVKLHNQSKVPLYLENVLANIKLADGTIVSVSAGSAGQYDEVFLVYPELAPLHATALSPRATIAPGKTVEGNLLWASNNMAKSEWGARKGLDFTFNFHFQDSLVLAPHSAIIEQ